MHPDIILRTKMIFFWGALFTTPHTLDAYGTSPLFTELLNTPLTACISV